SSSATGGSDATTSSSSGGSSGCIQPPCTFNLAADYSPTTNPSGVWGYGWLPAVGPTMELYTDHQVSSQTFGMEVWSMSQPLVDGELYRNPDTTVAHLDGTVSVPPGSVALHPGPSGERTAVRWTAPYTGTFHVVCTFAGLSGYGGAPVTTTSVQVI